MWFPLLLLFNQDLLFSDRHWYVFLLHLLVKTLCLKKRSNILPFLCFAHHKCLLFLFLVIPLLFLSIPNVRSTLLHIHASSWLLIYFHLERRLSTTGSRATKHPIPTIWQGISEPRGLFVSDLLCPTNAFFRHSYSLARTAHRLSPVIVLLGCS